MKLEEAVNTMENAEINEYLDNEKSNDKNTNNIWKLEIPKINLDANIAEGTTDKVLDEYIGHFEETEKNKGNIGLAAHNRGYKVNYFEKLKDLEIGDEIIYKYNDVVRTYKVSKKQVINDSDWTKLEKTEENKLTLITCLENKPELRRCIEAVEK